MNVLITNDDGIYAEGLAALYKTFIKSHSVTVVAPERERSAVSHSITLHKPLRASRFSLEGGLSGYAVNGTPADCVKLGILEILGSKPDIVISGINPGANIGINLNYSGTVSAAKEAALCGISAIAVSIQGYSSTHLDNAAIFAEKLARKVVEKQLPQGTFLNVNLPDMPFAKTAGIKISTQDLSVFSEFFEKRIDPRNRTYFWQGVSSNHSGYNPDSDGEALSGNYISITPIKCDMTDYNMIEDIKKWDMD
ncbi:MAG: 5'/3'-nucleotidase SurE [Proteobacteria bacterium]|nr:5'/3'-nucleotidase SurE [Pseudomonadota bacterium]